MTYLIDTTMLVRLANAADIQHAVAGDAVMELHRRAAILHLTPQVMIEFRNVATRPTALNGLGLSIVDAETQALRFEAKFPLLPDTQDIFPTWKQIVTGLGIIGKQVHDARLVAVCHVHKVTHVLTFNVTHFTRMAAFGPGVAIVDPANV